MINSISGGGVAPAQMLQRMQDRMQTADVDGSGSVSKAEMSNAISSNGGDPSKVDKIFSKLDVDGDGEISQSDVQNAFEARMSKLQGSGGPAGADQEQGIDKILATLLESISQHSDNEEVKQQANELLQQFQSGKKTTEGDLYKNIMSMIQKELPPVSVVT